MIIAKNVGGEVEKFVDRMNQKGKEIGMNHTTFHNPHGLDINEEGNISCAYDMALLMRYCLDNELFQEITGTKRYHCPNIGIWENKHKLLQKYEYCIGGKTGFTSKAKRTLVSAAKKDGLQLICVTLDCGGDFSFHRQLFESYFQRFEGLPLLEKGNNYINDYVFYTRKSYTVFIPKEKAHHLLVIYALDVNRKTITFRIVYQDATEDVYGPFSIESFQKIK
jgi:D-alanyl-D-alanine carboxypeptidase (penicillin-binding protein 5/6)